MPGLTRAGAIRGFTLIELVLTLVLIGILAAAGVPRFFSSGGFIERGFFDDTLAAIRYAQKLAVATGCPVQVSIAGGYALNQRATSCNSGAYTQPVVNPAGDQPGYSSTVPSSVSITAAPAIFTYDALGQASSDVAISVGATRQIVVVADTGYVYGTP